MGIDFMTSLGATWAEQRQLRLPPGTFSAEFAAANGGAPNRAVLDRYGCPKEFVALEVDQQHLDQAGYFSFGHKTACYGRSDLRGRASEPEFALHDALRNVFAKGGRVRFPFNPSEIIDNLRLERYANGRELQSGVDHLLRRVYYLLRPLTTRRMRSQVQKFRARNWRKQLFPKWPVDTTVEDVCEMVLATSMEAQAVDKVPFVWFWPDGATACTMITHDVESDMGRDHCTELMDIDDAFGIKAAFGLVPEERYQVSPGLLDTIRKRNFEIVVQDLNHDGQLFDNREEFLRRAKRINGYGREYGAKGFRAAVLYRKPEWYDALEFAFDMSIPNVAHLDPQHGGCCTVMPYFIGDKVELPVTTTQDYMLFHVLNQFDIDLWKVQIERILEKHGLMSFIVHPDYVTEPEKLSIYEALLGYLEALAEERSLWFALPSEIDAWWRARSKMSVVKDGNFWRIEGDDTNRAVLAYAKRGESGLEYELQEGRGQAEPRALSAL